MLFYIYAAQQYWINHPHIVKKVLVQLTQHWGLLDLHNGERELPF